MKRIESLDYLRGLMALSVMLYHYVSWHVGKIDSEFLLGKLGIYAVAIFYVLSGLSLTIVYQNKVSNSSDVLSFFIKRIFRIFPLFYLTVTCMLFLRFLYNFIYGSTFHFSAYTIFLNYSLLFGFVEPSASIPTGGWSIGNEMVFYVLLPFIFLLSHKSRFAVPIFMFLSIALGLYWAFILLDVNVPIGDQWTSYINPFNQIHLFMAGVLIGVYGELLREIIPKPVSYVMLLSAMMLFWLYPVSGNQIHIAAGVNRVILSACCILFVLFIFLTNPKFKPLFGKPLAFLGECCYSIYLLHPVVAYPIFSILHRLNENNYHIISGCVSFVLTLIVSWFSFNYIEKPMMNIGHDLSKRVPMRFISRTNR